jgi:hypothetical protein
MAQMAATRTSGEASESKRSAQGTSSGASLFIAHETVAADALDGRARESFPKARIVERGELGKTRSGERRAGCEGHLARALRKLVPRTDRETIVATIDAIAHGGAKFARDVALVLDGEIGNAAPRIEHIRRGERARGTDIHAAPAGAAMIGRRRVRRQRKRREQRAQKEPGTEVARDEIGVLALPAETCGFGQRLFHDGCGVDEDLDLTSRLAHEPACERLELLFHHLVIVAAAGVDRDDAQLPLVEQSHGIVIGSVIDAEHDDALDGGP